MQRILLGDQKPRLGYNNMTGMGINVCRLKLEKIKLVQRGESKIAHLCRYPGVESEPHSLLVLTVIVL